MVGERRAWGVGLRWAALVSGLLALGGCGDKLDQAASQLKAKVHAMTAADEPTAAPSASPEDQPARSGGSAGEARGATALPKPQPPKARALQALRERGVDTSGGLVERGGELRFAYETAAADDYEDQLLVVWATAFGALGRVARDRVTIVNTVGRRPVMTVTATTRDIRAMLDGALSTKGFLARMEIRSVERHPKVLEPAAVPGILGAMGADGDVGAAPMLPEEEAALRAGKPLPQKAGALGMAPVRGGEGIAKPAPRAAPTRRARPTPRKRRPRATRTGPSRPRASRPGR